MWLLELVIFIQRWFWQNVCMTVTEAARKCQEMSELHNFLYLIKLKRGTRHIITNVKWILYEHLVAGAVA